MRAVLPLGARLIPVGGISASNVYSYLRAGAYALGLGSTPRFLLVIFAEVGCSVLLVLGLWTRWAALILAFNMGVAFFLVNGASLAKGELAWLYFGGYLVLFVAGAGAISMDKK